MGTRNSQARGPLIEMSAFLAKAQCVLGRALAEIGPAFAQHYYQTFDTNRAALHTLYQDASMLTFENEQFAGMQAIMTKLTVRCLSASSRRGKVRVPTQHYHPPRHSDAAVPDGCPQGHHVRCAAEPWRWHSCNDHRRSCSGWQREQYQIRPGAPPSFLSPPSMGRPLCAPDLSAFISSPRWQTFHLMPAAGSWYIHNDLFRLNYG